MLQAPHPIKNKGDCGWFGDGSINCYQIHQLNRMDDIDITWLCKIYIRYRFKQVNHAMHSTSSSSERYIDVVDIGWQLNTCSTWWGKRREGAGREGERRGGGGYCRKFVSRNSSSSVIGFSWKEETSLFLKFGEFFAVWKYSSYIE